MITGQQRVPGGTRSAAGVATLLMPEARGGLVSLAAALVGASASLIRFGPSAEGLAGAVFLALIGLLAVADHRSRTYPNLIVLPAYAVVLIMTLPGGFHRSEIHLAAGFALGGVLLAVALAFPGSIGMGDVKVAALIGFALGGAAVIAAGVLLFCTLSVLAYVRFRPFETRASIPSWPIWVAAAAIAFLVGGW